MNKLEQKFLRIIVRNPGTAAASMPRAKRGETIKSLEMNGFIHYGPGGWFPTDHGIAQLALSETNNTPSADWIADEHKRDANGGSK